MRLFVVPVDLVPLESNVEFCDQVHSKSRILVFKLGIIIREYVT
jgi:hypothetical protein